jgi:rod shape-determining protein MreC
MVADTRFKVTLPLRAAMATVLHPVERMLLAPVRAWVAVHEYVGGLAEARAREAAALRRLAEQSERASRVDQQLQENARLRELLGLRAQIAVKTEAAEVLYEAADPYSRKIVIDRGATHGIAPASPVIDAAGVLGQVTRVYPLASEVTLLTDKDAAIPVINTRTQARGLAYGDPTSLAAGAGMEQRFLANNADVQPGDVLLTSGVDAVYPPGLPVARVQSVDRRAGATFAKVVLAPSASPDSVRHVLVLEPLKLQLPPRPVEPVASAPERTLRPGVGRR